MNHQAINHNALVHVDARNAPREQRKAISRMASTNGKTDLPRNCWSESFRANYISIFGKRKYD